MPRTVSLFKGFPLSHQLMWLYPMWQEEPDYEDRAECVKRIIEAVKERDGYVIGENESTEEIDEASEWEYGLERNILKTEQRKRAEETI